MTSESELDVSGIDAVLDRFRSRRQLQQTLRAQTVEWEVDSPRVLKNESVSVMQQRFVEIAARVSTEVSGALRAHVHFQLAELRQNRWRSVVDHLPERLCAVDLAISGAVLPAFVVFDLKSATSIIDRLVGGNGASTEIERPFTAIERRVLSDVLRPFVTAHEEILSAIMPLDMSIGTFRSVRNDLRIWPSTELFLVARYQAKMDRTLDWTFDFLLPIEGRIEAIERASSVPVQLGKTAEDRRRALSRTLRDVRIAAAIDVGSAELTLADVTALVPGDVVVLDRKRDQLLELKVEGVAKYRGALGRTGKSLAFKVTNVIGGPEVARTPRKG